MARPTKCRRICMEPARDSFVPEKEASEGDVVLSLDEFEVVRLVDLEKLTHELCASQMGISRTTVTELYESARYKIADCLVCGKRLTISGGHYKVCDGTNPCCRKRCAKRGRFSTTQFYGKDGTKAMKIAVT